MSDYEIIKDFIKRLLEPEYYKASYVLQSSDIVKKVNEVKDLTFNEAFAKFLGLTQKLAENDYARMVSEFETMFNVKWVRDIT